MTLVLSFSPYTTADMRTKLVFKTLHATASMDEPVAFPAVDDARVDANRMERILNLVICHQDARCFLREVVPAKDLAGGGESMVSQPMDFGLMRKNLQKGRYRTFSNLVNDMRLVIDNAFKYDWVENKREIRQSAVRLSLYIRDLLEALSHPGRSAEIFAADASTLHKEVERRITNARHKYRSDMQMLSEMRSGGFDKGSMKRKSVFERLCNVRDSGTLRGVVEIITGRPFEEVNLPCKVDLEALNDDLLQKLVCCLDSYSEAPSSRSTTSTVTPGTVWHPELPADLQDIRAKYKRELDHWLKTPSPDADVR